MCHNLHYEKLSLTSDFPYSIGDYWEIEKKKTAQFWDSVSKCLRKSVTALNFKKFINTFA